MPIIKPMASKLHSAHIMDVVTIFDYQLYLQGFKEVLLQFKYIYNFCQLDLDKEG